MFAIAIMHSPIWAAVVLGGFVALGTSQSLEDALVAAGASGFAALLFSNATLVAMVRSGQIKTVFAPADSASSLSWLAKRTDDPPLGVQFCDSLEEIALSTKRDASCGATSGGKVLNTTLPAPGLGPNQTQVVVTDHGNQSDCSWSSHAVYSSSTRVASGLGLRVKVIKANIPFDGGLIQLTDGYDVAPASCLRLLSANSCRHAYRYFTNPQSVSTTAQAVGASGFANLLTTSNISLDTTPAVTVFLPSNTGFSGIHVGANNSVDSVTAAAAELISSHTVPNFLGYLPRLTDGLILKTLQGGVLKVSIRDGVVFINNARITKANLILGNGVAHIIDEVSGSGFALIH